jgi:dihydroxyacid dehydratase/phosphogluconate dehydratase
MKYLLQKGFLHGDCITVTGKTIAENVTNARDLDFEKQDVIVPIEKAIKKNGPPSKSYMAILLRKDLLQKSRAKKVSALKEPPAFSMASLNWWMG